MSGRRGLSIRGADAGDAAAVAEMLADAGHRTAPGLLAQRLTVMAAAQGAVLVAWEWGPPSGLVTAHWYNALHSPLRIAQIDLLVVVPDARRRGIGRLLLKAVSQAARVAGCGTIDLVARPDDAATAAFCLATGFAPAGCRLTRPLRKAEAPR